MRHFVNKKINAGHIYQVRAADAIPNINFSLPKEEMNFVIHLIFTKWTESPRGAPPLMPPPL